MKDSLTEQLMDQDRILSFSNIAYSTESGFNRGILEGAIDCDRVLEKIEELFDKSELQGNVHNENDRVKLLYDALKGFPA